MAVIRRHMKLILERRRIFLKLTKLDRAKSVAGAWRRAIYRRKLAKCGKLACSRVSAAKQKRDIGRLEEISDQRPAATRQASRRE